MAARRRLDAELVRRNLAPSRDAAKRLIESGRVLVGGAPTLKAAYQVDPAQDVAGRGKSWRAHSIVFRLIPPVVTVLTSARQQEVLPTASSSGGRHRWLPSTLAPISFTKNSAPTNECKSVSKRTSAR